MFPKLLLLIKAKIIDNEVENFIFSMVKQNLEYREKNNVSRKDFFQLLIQLRNTGKVQLDDDWDTKIVKNEKEKQFSINDLASQSFVFFAAGFETSSTTMSYCLYELARNPGCQQNAQQEIDKILEKYDGQITYDSVSEMTYLDHCVDGNILIILL